MLALKVLVLIFLISFISTTHKFPYLLLIALSPWGPIFGPPSIYLSLCYLQASCCCLICSTSPCNSSDWFSIYLFCIPLSQSSGTCHHSLSSKVLIGCPFNPTHNQSTVGKSRIVDSSTVIQCLHRLHLDG